MKKQILSDDDVSKQIFAERNVSKELLTELILFRMNILSVKKKTAFLKKMIPF